MEQLREEKNLRKPRILVAPLDWGLGHATRCIPIIKELLEHECEVFLAGEGDQQQLLQREFPQLPFLSLKGYRVKYARSAIGVLVSIIRQTHHILNAIRNENAWLKNKIKEYEFDAVIADNRYGLHHFSIPCVFITHQLIIKSPLGEWTEKILQKRNYRFISHFAQCWVPDEAGENNLAGELSHPEKMPGVPLKYIGPLSRFHTSEKEAKKDHLLIILSGPEPQRTILKNKIIDELSHYNGTATVLRGRPSSGILIPSTNMIRFYNHLCAEELLKEMEQAEYIISRCGYSTIMDLAQLQKKSILIPTPGQTEQEYLARYLSKKQIAYCISQKEFSLTAALKESCRFSYKLPRQSDNNNLKKIIAEFFSSLPKRKSEGRTL